LAQEEAEQRNGADYLNGGTVAGMTAHPKALDAVRFALGELGKPYVWGDEGPDSYDCSGLMWAAYRSTGKTLNRVAKDQYYGTRNRPVSRYALLPGDLLFFSETSNWQDIHHVGMYIGGGKMVQAPTTGDVVKISTVWWSRFFAATRVYGEVPAPTRTPILTPTPSRTPSPSPTRTTAPAPTTSKPTPTASSPTTGPDPTEPAPTPSSTVEVTPTETSPASATATSAAVASGSPSADSTSTVG
jgi:hypothetical protein